MASLENQENISPAYMPDYDSNEIMKQAAAYGIGDLVLAAGQDLITPGEICKNVYWLTDGWIAVYDLLGDGRRQILQFALPGTVLNFFTSEQIVAANGAEALTDATVGVVPRGALAALFRDCPQIGIRFAEAIARDRSLCFDHLTSVGRRSANVRVARLLLELFVRSRSYWPKAGIEVASLPITQEHIGDALGLTSVHVNRVLNDLKKEGVLQFHYRRLTILDAERLVETAGIDAQQHRSWSATKSRVSDEPQHGHREPGIASIDDLETGLRTH